MLEKEVKRNIKMEMEDSFHILSDGNGGFFSHPFRWNIVKDGDTGIVV